MSLDAEASGESLTTVLALVFRGLGGGVEESAAEAWAGERQLLTAARWAKQTLRHRHVGLLVLYGQLGDGADLSVVFCKVTAASVVAGDVTDPSVVLVDSTETAWLLNLFEAVDRIVGVHTQHLLLTAAIRLTRDEAFDFQLLSSLEEVGEVGLVDVGLTTVNKLYQRLEVMVLYSFKVEDEVWSFVRLEDVVEELATGAEDGSVRPDLGVVRGGQDDISEVLVIEEVPDDVTTAFLEVPLVEIK